MKKLLFTLLLVSNFSFGQITINEIFGGGQNTCSPPGIIQVTISARDFTAGRLYIAVIFSDSSTSYGTLTATAGADWDTVSQIGNSTRKISVYRSMPTSSITSDTKIEFSFGSYPNAVFFHIYEITGVQTGNNGANAIRQVVADSSTGTNPTITMAALGNRNAVLSFFSNSLSPFSGTPESGWTELLDVGCETYVGSAYTNGMYAMDMVNTTDNTPTVTASSSDWVGLAIELRQANCTGNDITFNTDYSGTACGAPPYTSWSTVGIPFVADNLYIAFIEITGVGVTPTFTSDSSNFVLLNRLGSSTNQISFWRYMPTVSSTDGMTVAWGGANATSFRMGIYKVSNVLRGDNGANAISQIVYDSANAADPTFTVTNASQRTAQLVMITNNQNPFGGTPESGYTEVLDYGCATAPSGVYVMNAVNIADTTPTVTATSSDWKGAVFVFRQCIDRRITLID